MFACTCTMNARVCYIKGGSQRGTQTSRGHRDLEVRDELSLFCAVCACVLLYCVCKVCVTSVSADLEA